MLEKERAYYESNLNSLRETYMGRYVLISGDRLIGGYDSDEEAYASAMEKNCMPGSFMIKPVIGNDQEYIQRFTSRVYV